MEQRTLTRLYDVHCWTGALLGLFLFALCFSGTVALVYDELEPWERPAARGTLPPPDTPIDRIVREHLPDDLGALHSPFVIFLPEPYRPTLQVGIDGHETGFRVDEFEPVTGQWLGRVHDGVGYFLRDLHTDLHLPSPYGRYLVGLGGMIMLLSIVSGVLIHRKILVNLLVFRPDRSRRLAWTDGHNVFGAWGLPFHLMIAFTGALLGLAALFLTVLALAAYGGDRDAALEAVVGELPVATGVPADMVSVDALLADARQRSPDARAVSIVVHRWGDAAAEAHVRMEGFADLNWLWEHRYRLSTGAMLETWSLGDHPGGRIYQAMTPLHYGTYGGLALKALYGVLGAASSILIATGLMIWVERRRPRTSTTMSQPLGGLIVGTCAGMVVATAGALAVHHLLPTDAGRVFAVGVGYFALWLGAAAYGCWRRDNYRSLRELLLAAAVLLALAPLVQMASLLWQPTVALAGPSSLAAPITNVFLILAAAALLLTRHYVPATRRERQHRRKPAPAL